MRDRPQCPECEGYNTERAMVDWRIDGVDEVRICEACNYQWTNAFERPRVTEEHHFNN